MFQHPVRVLVYFVGRKCRDQFLVATIHSDANFLDKMSKKLFTVIKSASISVATVIFFHNFYEKIDMNAVWVNIVVVGE